MELSFEKFLERISRGTKEYECDTTNIIVINATGDETKIASRIPMIYEHIMEWEEEAIRFTLTIGLRENEDKTVDLEVIVDGSKQSDICIKPKEVEEIIDTLYYKEKWIKDKKALCVLLVRYFIHYIRDYLNTDGSIYARCGWKKVEHGREFYSVTKRLGEDFPYIREIFGGDVFQMLKRRDEFSQILDKYNQCREFYDLLCKNPILISIFAYTIHALIWDFGCTYEKENYDYCTDYVENRDTLFFSVCIHGKDINKAKLIANILCNLFNEPKDNWAKISLLHHVSATSLNTNAISLRKYSSVPIIVTSKKNHIIKSSKAVTELHRYRKNMKLFIYPVYINDVLINVDEMVNFNIDKVCLPFSVKDKEMAHKIHSQMTMLLFSFVCSLRDKSMKWKRDNAQGEAKRNLMNAMEDVEQEWVEDNLPEFLLYAALKAFCNFINLNQGEIGDKLLSVYRSNVVNNGQMKFNDQQTQKNQIDAEQERRYLLCLHELIIDALKKKGTWLIEENEPRDDKERCYYLDSEWYDRFCAKLKKEKIESVGKRKITEILKNYQILKLPKSGKSIVMKRYDKYCYVILADILDEKVNYWNTLSE